jgi:2-dehydro-3-deoxyphosphooctonate aldolase (KDO 8-P synthase)
MSIVQVGDITIGDNYPTVLMAGPCVIEEHIRDTWGPSWQTASQLQQLTKQLGIPFIFKASFDKANRSHISSFRGPGITDGITILQRIKAEFNLPIMTDIHDINQVAIAAPVVDIIQIPAFLCRQTDLLIEAGKSGRVVNVKKGQFLAADEIKGIASKLDSVRAKYVFTERGMTFGPHNLIVDMRSIEIMKSFAPVIYDATHSVQMPGTGIASSGQKQFIFPLARAATAVGIHGLFFEVHPDPTSAKCDGANMLALAECNTVFTHLRDLDRFTKNSLYQG